MKKSYQLILSLFATISLIGCATNSQDNISSLEQPSSTVTTLSSKLDNTTSKESQNQSSGGSSSDNKTSSASSNSQRSSSEGSSSQVSSSNYSSSSSSSSHEGGNTSSEPSSVSYHIIFKNYDGTVLEEKDVLEGGEGTYTGETPTKEEDDDYTYTFVGWDKESELKVVASDIIAIAQFEANSRWGSIIWF